MCKDKQGEKKVNLFNAEGEKKITCSKIDLNIIVIY